MKFQVYRSCVCYALFCLTLSQQQLFPSLLISNDGQSSTRSFSHVEAFSISIEGPTASEWSTRDEYVGLLKAQEQQQQPGDIAQAPPMGDQQAFVAEQLREQQQQQQQRQLLQATPSFANLDGSAAASGSNAMNIVLSPDSQLQSATSLTRSRQHSPQGALNSRDSFLVENNNNKNINNNYEQQLEETLDQLDSLHQQHRLLQQQQAKSNSNRRRQIQEDSNNNNNNYLINQGRQRVMAGGPSPVANAFELIAATNSHQQNQNHNQHAQQQHHPIISIIDNSGKTISRSLADLVAIGDSDLQEQENGQDGDYLDPSSMVHVTNSHPRIRERADLTVCGDRLIEALELVCEKRFFAGEPTIAEPIITKSRRSVNPAANNLKQQQQSLSPLNHIPKKHLAANENDQVNNDSTSNNSNINSNNSNNNNDYSDNRRSSRSIDDSLELLSAGVNQNNNNNNYHDRKTASIALQQPIKPSRRAAMRRARAASDECCKSSCSIQQLKNYCEKKL